MQAITLTPSTRLQALRAIYARFSRLYGQERGLDAFLSLSQEEKAELIAAFAQRRYAQREAY